MLSEILRLLESRGAMSLRELAIHFRVEPSALEGMLELLERKGRVERLDSRCRGCKGCVEMRREDCLLYRAVRAP